MSKRKIIAIFCLAWAPLATGQTRQPNYNRPPTSGEMIMGSCAEIWNTHSLDELASKGQAYTDTADNARDRFSKNFNDELAGIGEAQARVDEVNQQIHENARQARLAFRDIVPGSSYDRMIGGLGEKQDSLLLAKKQKADADLEKKQAHAFITFAKIVELEDMRQQISACMKDQADYLKGKPVAARRQTLEGTWKIDCYNEVATLIGGSNSSYSGTFTSNVTNGRILSLGQSADGSFWGTWDSGSGPYGGTWENLTLSADGKTLSGTLNERAVEGLKYATKSQCTWRRQ